MTVNALVCIGGLAALLLLIAAICKVRRHRLGAGLIGLLASLTLVLVVTIAMVAALSLRTYQRMNAEKPAGPLRFTRIGYHQCNAVLTYPNGESADFPLRGDEWQIDARILKWHGMAQFLGFDTGNRLDRISGRYTNGRRRALITALGLCVDSAGTPG